MAKLTEQEINERSLELADKVCELEDCLRRKHDFMAQINKEIKFLKEIILQIAQGINDGLTEPVVPTVGQNENSNI